MSAAPTSSYWLARLIAGPAAAFLVVLIPLPGLEPAAQSTAAIAVWMAVWWMTEAVPIPVTSLLPLVAFPSLANLLRQPAGERKISFFDGEIVSLLVFNNTQQILLVEVLEYRIALADLALADQP